MIFLFLLCLHLPPPPSPQTYVHITSVSVDLTVKPLDPDRKPQGDRIQDPTPPALFPMATIQDYDELLLARIGYKQVRAPVAPKFIRWDILTIT